MLKISTKKQLTIKEKLFIIGELDKPNPPNKRSLGRMHNVDESSVRYVWKTREIIKRRAEEMSEELQNKKSRFCSPKFNILEEQLYNWIKLVRNAKLPVSPTLTIMKAKELAEKLSISKEDLSFHMKNDHDPKEGLEIY